MGVDEHLSSGCHSNATVAVLEYAASGTCRLESMRSSLEEDVDRITVQFHSTSSEAYPCGGGLTAGGAPQVVVCPNFVPKKRMGPLSRRCLNCGQHSDQHEELEGLSVAPHTRHSINFAEEAKENEATCPTKHQPHDSLAAPDLAMHSPPFSPPTPAPAHHKQMGTVRADELNDIMPMLLRTLEEEHVKGTISTGEYNLWKDHVLSRDIYAIRRVNKDLLTAKARLTAPQQQIAKLAQLPRDPTTNRSSFGDVAVHLIADKHTAPEDEAQRQLHESLRRAIKALQSSFGDRIISVTFDHIDSAGGAVGVAHTGESGGTNMVLLRPKMVLSQEGEWVYPSGYQQQQQQLLQQHQQNIQQQRRQQQSQRQQQQIRQIYPDQISECQFQSFSVEYRVSRDQQGHTIDTGGISEDRQILKLSAEQPNLTESQCQQMIKGMAGCLN